MSTLDGFDLNLLQSLNVLLKVQHVSRAAEILNITQSGMSKNLYRLRSKLDDPLLVRVGNTMVLTPRAIELKGVVNQLLLDINTALNDDVFEPENYEMHFNVAVPDFLVQLYMPDLLSKLLESAPKLSINFLTWSPETFTRMEDGRVDFAFGGLGIVPAGIHRHTINDAEYVCISRKDHPNLSTGLTLERYTQSKHVGIALMSEGLNPIDVYLNQQGLSRAVVVTSPLFMSAVAIVAKSNLLMVIHSELAFKAQEVYQFDIHALPFKPEMPNFDMYWHERVKKSKSHQWFKEQVMKI